MALNSEQWKVVASIVLPRAGCAMGVVGDQVIVVGGTHWLDATKQWVDRADAFDPRSGQWSALPPFPMRSARPRLRCDGKLVIAGGGTADTVHREVWQYDGAAWSRFGPDLPAARRMFVAVPDGEELVLLGGMGAGPTDYGTATTMVWRGGRHGWREAAPMPGPARLVFAVGKVGGQIIVAGGFTMAGTNVVNRDEILAYDLATDRWQQIGRLPVALRAAAGLAWPGRGLILFGGYTDTFTREIQLVSPTGEVTKLGELPAGLADGRFAWWRDQIVGLSGEDGIKMRYASCLLSAAVEADGV